ncbi:MAG: glutamate 5-kinase [Holosporales bacterium]|jgi:glutamate 5-kinase|nr:glutamate 5-kinase [Holosporales bacterium]
MKIVIKIGTQSLLSEQGTPRESVFNALVEQIVHLKKDKHKIVLVSSGAVCLGRQVARHLLNKEYGSSIGEKQLLASLGQHELMGVYVSLFKQYGIAVSQVLLTKQDFETRKKYFNIKRIWEELFFNNRIIPIVNENDSVAIEELMFTDNDELSGLIASQIGADKLIILSNVEGVYAGPLTDKGPKLLPMIDPKTNWPTISISKSTHGRGGMFSKVNTARRVSAVGVTTHIAGAAHPHVLEEIVAGKQVGTVIPPSKKESSLKRWIACNGGHAEAAIIIDHKLCALLKNKSEEVSLLPVGIKSYTGRFKKGDIIKIMSLEGNTVGIGVARYGDKKLKEFLGQKNKSMFIHCDYLHVF